MARSYHLNRLRLRSRLSLERSEPCANARLVRGDPCGTMRRATRPQGLRISHCGRLVPSPYAAFSVRASLSDLSLAGIEPVGFRTKSDLRNHQAIIQPRRTKSDLRNHQAIIQPRLYDCLMVTQITLLQWHHCTVYMAVASLDVAGRWSDRVSP